LECVAGDKICDTVQDCNDGSDEKHCSCPECTCTDENDILTKCLKDEDEKCPNETDKKKCRESIPWWIWLIVVLVLLLILALLIWFFCREKCSKKKDPFKKDQDAGSEESQPMQPGGLDQKDGDCNPVPSPTTVKVQNGTISPTTPSPRIEIPPESPKKPSSPPPDFDWEQAAQRIVKDHRKNTAHIHVRPENGFLMTEFPKDRIHEERSVSPQPATVPIVQYAGSKINYPQSLDRQVSETGEVVRYAGPTQLPINTKGKKSVSKTPFNYADPKDH